MACWRNSPYKKQFVDFPSYQAPFVVMFNCLVADFQYLSTTNTVFFDRLRDSPSSHERKAPATSHKPQAIGWGNKNILRLKTTHHLLVLITCRFFVYSPNQAQYFNDFFCTCVCLLYVIEDVVHIVNNTWNIVFVICDISGHDAQVRQLQEGNCSMQGLSSGLTGFLTFLYTHHPNF